MRQQELLMHPTQAKAYARYAARKLVECSFKEKWDVVQEQRDFTRRWNRERLTSINYDKKKGLKASFLYDAYEPDSQMIAEFEQLLCDLRGNGQKSLADFLEVRSNGDGNYPTTDDMVVKVRKSREIVIKDPVFYKWEVDKSVYEQMTRGL